MSEPDQIDMMGEKELRSELRHVVIELLNAEKSILALSRALDDTLGVITEDAFAMSEKGLERLEEILTKHGTPKCPHCDSVFTGGGICGGCAGVEQP